MSYLGEVFAGLGRCLVLSSVAVTLDKWYYPAFKGTLELFEEILALEAE